MISKSEAAMRLIRGFSSVFRGIIVDSSIDEPSIFMEVLRGGGIGSLAIVSRIEGSNLHLIRINSKPCEARCRYEECNEGDGECMKQCIASCIERRVRQAVEKLQAMYVGEPRQPGIYP